MHDSAPDGVFMQPRWNTAVLSTDEASVATTIVTVSEVAPAALDSTHCLHAWRRAYPAVEAEISKRTSHYLAFSSPTAL